MSFVRWRHLLFACLLLVAGIDSAHTAPYGPDGKAIHWRQPGGAKVEQRVFGDEHYACTEALDGSSVVCDPLTKTNFCAALSANAWA